MLYLALDLGAGNWKLAFTVGLGQKPRLKTITARSTLSLVIDDSTNDKIGILSHEGTDAADRPCQGACDRQSLPSGAKTLQEAQGSPTGVNAKRFAAEC